MSNYKIEINAIKQMADVIELKTGITIASELPVSEARARMRQLNGGRGFNGFTPDFFLNRLIVPA